VEQRRVVITGVGGITPIGIGKDEIWKSVLACRRAGRPITRFDATSFSSQIAAEVNNFAPLDFIDAKRARRFDRFSQFGVATARLAIQDAGLIMEQEQRERVGVYIGSALGGIAYAEEQHVDFVASGSRSIHPMLALSVFSGASSANVAMDIGAYGPSLGNSNSCASGTIGIGEAMRAIRSGDVDVAIAGGVEAPLAPLTFGAFAIIKVLSTRNDDPATASRPFDKDRDGFVMAEGAGLLVLEELGHAVRRDAAIYAEVLGYGVTSDAYHMTAPRPDAVQSGRSIALALRDAGLPPESINYVAAHASSTVLNDKTETLAIKRALGDHAYRIPVSGTKGMHAHALGASGAMELLICALVMKHNIIPATVNLCEPDPDCDLAYVRDQPKEYEVSYMIKNSFGFGGVNATLVLGRIG
jgi:3-oxoacyl-[acyl-carrier-protein] synthase II